MLVLIWERAMLHFGQPMTFGNRPGLLSFIRVWARRLPTTQSAYRLDGCDEAGGLAVAFFRFNLPLRN